MTSSTRYSRVAAIALCASAAFTLAHAESGTMNAVVQHGYGGPEVLRVEKVPIPVPGPEQLRVRVYAAGINRDDAALRTGEFKMASIPGMPAVNPDAQRPGFELAGVVDALGPGVDQFKVGDPVYAMIFGPEQVPGNGALAEYAVVKVSTAARKPKSLTYVQAAGAGTSAETSLRSVASGKIEPGQKVIVVGAAGGIGSFSLQLAKSQGASVTAVDAAKYNDFLRKIGADDVVNYDRNGGADLARLKHTADVVINTASGQTKGALEYLRAGGTFVAIAMPFPTADQCKAAEIKCPQSDFTGKISDRLDRAAQLFDEGKLSVRIDPKTFSLSEAAAAQDYALKGQPNGKVIVVVDPKKAATKR